jgi:hypothetical protein
LGPEQKEEVFSAGGMIHAGRTPGELLLFPAPGSGIDILQPVMERNPNYLVEALVLVPYRGRKLNLLDIYNTLGNVQGLEGRLYHSASRDANVALFEKADRIAAKNKDSPIPAPPAAAYMPAQETIYLRLKDVNFGNSYYQAKIQVFGGGLLYGLSNTKSLSYLFIPVMKEDKFAAQIYLEPLDEGVLIYSIAGTEVSDFIANRVSISSAIRKRLEVIIDWISEGLRKW